MITGTELEQLSEAIGKSCNGDGMHEAPITGMHCLRFSAPGDAMPTVYRPSLCFIAQGAKQVVLENEIHHYQPSQYLAVSVDLPVLGQVTEASAGKPYLCLQIDIDAREVSDLIAQMGLAGLAGSETARGLFVGTADPGLMQSVLRLVKLFDTPKDIPLLAPLALREVYYRVLTGEHGQRIGHMGFPDSHTQRIMRVLQALRADFARTLRVEELAAMASMSASSFHHHFKQVTAMTPLQYQKRLRLLEARRILLSEEADASSTAYRVGYESPSQFSREYYRMFGAPPMRDLETLRNLSRTAAV